MAMSSRAIPGRVDPGSSRQDPAALTPNKQSGGHRHIPGRSLGTAGALGFLFIPIPRRGTAGVWAAGCPGDWRHPKPEVAPRASRGGVGYRQFHVPRSGAKPEDPHSQPGLWMAQVMPQALGELCSGLTVPSHSLPWSLCHPSPGPTAAPPGILCLCVPT